jgi:wyosine [tRNA(Phe)-imidazoG37] synthetase (radical SAM superfamily)
MTRSHVYGPVGSRRFGISLGVDPVEPKTCSYDCVYCQQGRTTHLSLERREFVPLRDLIDEVAAAIERGPAADVITIAGSGEPTLYLPLGALIDGLHEISTAPVVLLTNGSLAQDPEVRAAAARADVLGPSLDAADEETFARINRPHPKVSFDGMVQGLRALRQEATGRFDLEVFIARGINDSAAQVEAIAALARSIDPDSIQLNTAVRPVPGRSGLALTRAELDGLLGLFGPRAEIIASFEAHCSGRGSADPVRILEVLERRPCTAAQIAAALDLDRGAVDAALAKLERLGQATRAQGSEYWHCGPG